ncbi:hypothetical protein ACLZX5_04130 [Enterococcus faecium]
MKVLFGEVSCDELRKSIEKHEKYKREKYADILGESNLKKNYEILLYDTFFLCNIFSEFNEFYHKKKDYYLDTAED